MPVIEIEGDLLETDCSVIAHGVNCQNKMGSGVAKVLFDKWPEVKTFYHRYCDENSWENNRELLSDYHEVKVKDGVFKTKIIRNCFTQLYYGYDGNKYISYDAIFDCFREIAEDHKEVAIPRIGCGLAGGNWEIVKRIIEDAVGDRCTVKVYTLGDKNGTE